MTDTLGNTTLDIREVIDHVFVKQILKLYESSWSAYYALGRKSSVLRNRDKAHVHVRTLLIEMNYCGKDILFAESLLIKPICHSEEDRYILQRLTLEELGGSSTDTILHYHTVLSNLAADFLNPLKDHASVTAGWSFEMEVVMRLTQINIRVALILFLLTFVMLFKATDCAHLAFVDSHNCICHK
jgi:hypothetical protein